MDKPTRIVKCPKCLALLQEPPPGTPLYKCGNCSTVLRAKHSIPDAHNGKKVQQHGHHNDGPPTDHVNRQTYINVGRQLPVSQGPRGPNQSDHEDHTDRRQGHKHHGSTPADLAKHGSLEDFNHRKSRPTELIHQFSDPSPADQERSHASLDDIIDRRKGPTNLIISSRQIHGSAGNGHKSSPSDLSGEAADASERQPDEDCDDDLSSFSPTKALAARRSAGPLYKAREKPRTEWTGSSSVRNSTACLYKGRSSSQESVEGLGKQASNIGLLKQGMHRRLRSEQGLFVSERSLENESHGGRPERHTATSRSSEDLIGGQDRSPEEDLTSFRAGAQKENSLPHSGEALVEIKNPSMGRARQDVETIGGLDLVEDAIETHGKKFSRGPMSFDRDTPAKQAIKGTHLEEMTVKRAGFGNGGQQKAVNAKAQHEEEVIVNKYTLTEDEEDEEQALSVFTKSKPTGRRVTPGSLALSPPSSSAMWSNFGRVRPFPEHLSEAQAGLGPDVDSPPTPKDMYGPPDVLSYDTSEDSFNMDDAEPDQGSRHSTSRPHSEELEFPFMDQKRREGGKTDRSAGQPEVTVPSGRDIPESSPHGSPQQSPESTRSADSQKSDRHLEMRGRTPTLQSDAPESANRFSSHQGGQLQGADGAPAEGQSQILRLQINIPLPERIHVKCRHCALHLEVPLDLPPSHTGLQKLRCGACWKVSRFRLNHLLSPDGNSSPAGSDFSPGSSLRFGPNSPDDASGSGGYSGTRSNRETGVQNRTVTRTQSGGTLPLPPSTRHNSRPAIVSKLSNMTKAANLRPETSEASTPSTSGDLGPAQDSLQGGREHVDMSPLGDEKPSNVSLSPALSNASQDTSADRLQKPPQDRKILQSSSDSDEEKPSVSLNLDPIAPLPAPMNAWSAPDPSEFDDGHESKGLRGFLKRSVMEFTKGKKANQYRRKVVVNAQAVPDDVVRRAEEYAGPIHPGSYWYDIRAGFWGTMGGPCLGMIPPFIDELNYPLARHCSNGKTGVLVNGRELHQKDLELLKKRGLPGTPGKAYDVDIDGRLLEVATGHELKGLGRLAPTLEKTGKGPGMWVPESNRGS